MTIAVPYTNRDIAELLAQSAASVGLVDAEDQARLERGAANGDELASATLRTIQDVIQGTGLIGRATHPCVACAEPVRLPDGVAAMATIIIHGPPRHVLAGVICAACTARGRDWVLERHAARISSFRIPDNSKETSPMSDFDYSADFDPAPTSAGPWIHFYCKPSTDGAVPSGSWGLRDGSQNLVLDLSRGFVLDWPAVKTGWIQASGVPGVAPVKKWNTSRSRFEPKPPGDNWAKGFCAPIAYANDAEATWEQWGAGVWIGFAEMFKQLMQEAPGKIPALPLIVPARSRAQKFAAGTTLIPVLQVARYVPRPACLPEGNAQPLQVSSQPQSQVTYSYPPPQSVQSPTVQHRHAPITPSGWDAPAPGMMNMAGKDVPISPPEEPELPSTLDEEIPF